MDFELVRDPTNGKIDYSIIRAFFDDGWISVIPDTHKDWKYYTDWLADGNEPRDAPPWSP